MESCKRGKKIKDLYPAKEIVQVAIGIVITIIIALWFAKLVTA